MIRVIRYTIDEGDKQKKISGFLKGKGYSAQNLADLKKCREAVLVDGRAARLNDVLRAGEVLTITIAEEEQSAQIQPVHFPVEIIYEDEDLLVVNKPAGMPIQPSHGNAQNSLGNAMMDVFAQRGERFVYRCINRLDRDTSGLTVVAKHSVSAAVLGSQVRDRERAGDLAMHREYLVVVAGHLQDECGTVRAPIARVEDQVLRMAVDWTNGQEAVTHYRVLAEGKDATLLSCILETGRTHQIRVHMQYLGHPLLGDYLYHPDYQGNRIDRRTDGMQADMTPCPIGRQMLHAWKLSLVQPMTGERMHLIAPIPADMQRIMHTFFS